ncbi:hypothetical protein [Corynebacterium sp. 20_84]
MKKRTAFIAATLSAAMAFSVAPAVAETTDVSNASTDTGTNNDGDTTSGNDDTTSETGDDKGKTKPAPPKDKDGDDDNGKTKPAPNKPGKDKDEDEEEEENPNALDPTKGKWDNGGASSEAGKEGPFGSSGLNRISNYTQSNQFKSISTIVALISGVITVGSQVAALIISVSPTAKAQFDNFLRSLR